MAGIFPPSGVPPGVGVCNGFTPTNMVIGQGPLYASAKCTTLLPDCSFNAILSEILAAVDWLGIPYNANRVDNLGRALREKFDEKVDRSGDEMTGPLLLSRDPLEPMEAATKRWVELIRDALQLNIDDKVNRSGDTMTGLLVLAQDPVNSLDAATKQYVDHVFSGATQVFVSNTAPANPTDGTLWWDTVTGQLFIWYDDGDSAQWVSTGNGGETAGGGDGGGGIPDAPHLNRPFGRMDGFWTPVLALAGGTLTGPLFLTGAMPTQPNQAATKAYVDNLVGTGGGAWSTGDAKLTMKANADPGWVMMDDGSIGDENSAATTRAESDCHDLFLLIWNRIPDQWAPVEDGRGSSAEDDWLAHKTIALTRQLGCTLAIAGHGEGLTDRPLGSFVGEETHSLVSAEIAQHMHSAADSGHGHFAQADFPYYTFLGIGQGQAPGPNTCLYGSQSRSITVHIGYANVVVGGMGSNAPHNNMQPTSFWNIMIKL
ncbi:MAG: hypothetical protein C5B54_04120 [Acidobacteria bacterium]|nr:MAG: hypothetical protein C5B54_04120 [Acidobacteriota bacterium]